MTKPAAPLGRAGQENASHDTSRQHILVLFAENRHGTLDRIIGLLRRRRSNMQTFALGQSEQAGVVRITVVVDDAEVEVAQLVEQLRKLADVRQITNLPPEQAVARELALIKVNSTASQQSEIIELGHLFGAHIVDANQETVTLEVTGSADKIQKLVDLLQSYGIREVARTGCVAMTRGTGETHKE